MASTLENHPSLDGVVLFSAPLGMHVHDDHSHDGFSIIVVTGGSKTFRNTGRVSRVSELEIAIANPGEIHGCGPASDAPWSHKTWYVSAAFVQQLMGETQIPKLQSPVIRDATIAAGLIEAHDGICDGAMDPDAAMIANEALAALFDAYAQTGAKPESDDLTKPQQRTARCIEYMQSNINTGVDLAALASLAGVSRNQLIRDFRRVYQTTPGQYFRLLRLRQAKQSMESGQSLSDVASAAGYSDQSHFIRHFRKAFGVTPKHALKLNPGSPL
ncbi:MAG: AraC family transcriptional regulator [Pseudomonadota bacterium]